MSVAGGGDPRVLGTPCDVDSAEFPNVCVLLQCGRCGSRQRFSVRGRCKCCQLEVGTWQPPAGRVPVPHNTGDQRLALARASQTLGPPAWKGLGQRLWGCQGEGLLGLLLALNLRVFQVAQSARPAGHSLLPCARHSKGM